MKQTHSMKKSPREQIKLMRLITGEEMKNREECRTTNLFQEELDRARITDSNLEGSLKDVVNYLHKNPLAWQNYQFSYDFYDDSEERERIREVMQRQTPQEPDPFVKYENPSAFCNSKLEDKLTALRGVAAKRFEDVFSLRCITSPFYHSLESAIDFLITEGCGFFTPFDMKIYRTFANKGFKDFNFPRFLRGIFMREISKFTGEEFGDEDKSGETIVRFPCGKSFNRNVCTTRYELVPTKTNSLVFQDMKKAEAEGLFSAVGSFAFQRYIKVKEHWDYYNTQNPNSRVGQIKTHKLPCIIALDTCGILYIAAQESDVKESEVKNSKIYRPKEQNRRLKA